MNEILGAAAMIGAVSVYVFIVRSILNKNRGHYEKR